MESNKCIISRLVHESCYYPLYTPVTHQNANRCVKDRERIKPPYAHRVGWKGIYMEREKKITETIRLTNDEYRVLNKISSKTHMDCWFRLEETKNGKDYVRDIEENRDMTLTEGVSLLVEGIASYHLCELSDEEISILEMLLIKLRIDTNVK